MHSAARAVRNARIGIVGAGLAGSTSAHTLRKLGFTRVRVFDRAARAALAGGNKPVVIAPNAMRALRRVDLAAAVYERAQWVQSYIQTDKLSRPLMELSDIPAVFRAHVPPLLKADAAGDAFVSMTRAAYADAALQSTPLDSLSLEHGLHLATAGVSRSFVAEVSNIRVVQEPQPPIKSNPKSRASARERTNPRTVVELQLGGTSGVHSVEHFDIVIVADGALSAARSALFRIKATEGVVATPQRLVQGLVKSAPVGAPFGIDTLCEGWGNGSRFGLVGLPHGSWQWYCALLDSPELMKAFKQGHIAAVEAMVDRVAEYQPFAAAAVRATREGAFWHERVSYRRPSSNQWFYSSPSVGMNSLIAFVGQAVAVAPPDLYQAAALSVESGIVLAQCLARAASSDGADLRDAFEQYRLLREPRVIAVITNALAEAQQGNTLGVFATAMRDMATGMMPKAARSALFESTFAHDAMKPFES